MVDYHKDTGSSGDMMIRDLGSVVEFWINSHNSTTFNYSLPWGFTVNGVTSSRTARYEAGEGWLKLGSWTVSTSQTVTFRLGATGTGGFGGPTTFSQAISRGAKPNPPSKVTLTSISFTSVFGTFTDGAANGHAIDARQIGYGTASTAPQVSVSSDKSTLITGLTPRTKYYFWARTHNVKGWSAWGPRSEATTLAGVTIWVQVMPGVVRTQRAVPWVNVNGVWRQARPWANHAAVWKLSG